MLRYRVLLVDTEQEYKRPVQALFNTVPQATDWAKAVLQRAGKAAYVVLYLTTETEVGTFKRTDFFPPVEANDQITVPDIQQTQGPTSKP